MRIDILDHFPRGLDDLARQSNEATFYHTAVWLQCLAHAYPSLRLRVIVAVESGTVFGYLPFFEIRRGSARRLWSLPFGTYGGPVTLGDPDVERKLLEALIALKGEGGVHEVGLVDFRGRLPAQGLKRSAETTHVLDLEPGFEELWSSRFEKSKRRQTRKAEREGLAVREAASADDVRRYHAIYLQKSDVWRQPVRYPEALFVDLFERGGENVKLFLAWKDDTLLGGHLNFYFKDTIIAWNGVTAESSRGTQAGTLLYARCIKEACEKGYRSYNLGASLGSASLIEYKEAIGGRPYSYTTLRWRSLGGRIASVVMKYLPKR